MRIAVCDLDKGFLNRFKAALYRYAEEHRLDIFAECYVSGESIEQSGYYYNLIFLGYQLAGINGLDTAKKLREKKNNTTIIFISDSTDFILQAFKVSAFRCLLKSKWEAELYPLLDDFFMEKSANYPIWVKSHADTVCLCTEDIYYLEADNKYCFINLEKETLSCHRTLSQVYGALPKSNFTKINRAFVVNLNYISRYNNDAIILKNGKILHPSRNFYKSFKDEYRRFLRPYEI
ncbi:MAG: response regulator transcription factor [Clostridia bacterium]|nr:response regulator transcription factor [Clostridia bacterium]